MHGVVWYVDLSRNRQRSIVDGCVRSTRNQTPPELTISLPLASDTLINFRLLYRSPLVKTQVLHTVTLLVSGVRDPSALYFILSQNCINALIACILPPALETTPALYVGLINVKPSRYSWVDHHPSSFLSWQSTNPRTITSIFRSLP